MRKTFLLLVLLVTGPEAVLAQTEAELSAFSRTYALLSVVSTDEAFYNALRGYDCASVFGVSLEKEADMLDASEIENRIASLLRREDIPTSGEYCAELTFLAVSVKSEYSQAVMWKTQLNQPFITQFGHIAFGSVWEDSGPLLLGGTDNSNEMRALVRDELALAIEAFSSLWYATR